MLDARYTLFSSLLYSWIASYIAECFAFTRKKQTNTKNKQTTDVLPARYVPEALNASIVCLFLPLRSMPFQPAASSSSPIG